MDDLNEFLTDKTVANLSNLYKKLSQRHSGQLIIIKRPQLDKTARFASQFTIKSQHIRKPSSLKVGNLLLLPSLSDPW
jgi:hypothetical protein